MDVFEKVWITAIQSRHAGAQGCDIYIFLMRPITNHCLGLDVFDHYISKSACWCTTEAPSSGCGSILTVG
eukprot:SAG22_NODE_18323_length_289_cov_0.810526_1_plen_69_part_10